MIFLAATFTGCFGGVETTSKKYKKELKRYIEAGNTEKMADMILNKMFIIKEEE